MAGVPRTVNLNRTSHFLFETGSLMLSAFGLLFLGTALPTIVVTYRTGSLPLLGGVAVLAFGALTMLGVGLLYWSVKFGDFQDVDHLSTQ